MLFLCAYFLGIIKSNLTYNMIFFIFLSLSMARLTLDATGDEEVILFDESNTLTLPENTQIRNQNTTIDIVQELEFLTSNLQALNNTIQQIRSAGCTWSGVGCHCHFSDSVSTGIPDMVVLVGSNCTNGFLYWTKILDVQAADFIIGCIAANTSLCDMNF